MAHVHQDEGAAFYYEQVCTMATCGALGVVMVLLWRCNVLAIFLDPKFHAPVLWGGIALLLLVALRLISLALAIRRGQFVHGHAHEEEEELAEAAHDHVHGPECTHDHAHEGAEALAIRAEERPAESVEGAHAGHQHAHDHDHDHGWQPWRYA